MSIRAHIVFIGLSVVASGCGRSTAQIANPRTAPEHSGQEIKKNAETLCRELVVAINGGDSARIQDFVGSQITFPPGDTGGMGAMRDRLLELYRAHSGLTFVRFDEQRDDFVRAILQANIDDGWVELILASRNTGDASKIIGLGFRDVPAPIDRLAKTRLSDEELQAKIDALVQRLVERDAFSGSVLVRRGDSFTYKRHVGFEDKAKSIAISDATRLHLASITKMFTAIAVAQLVEEGKLDWQSTIVDILPDYPNADVARQVTIRQLLSHTSGLVGAQQTVDSGLMPLSARTVLESWGTASESPLLFRPGQQFEYSNFGYCVLGRIIEVASGQNYHDYLREHVFLRAGMQQTEFVDLSANPEHIARGWMDGPTGRVDNRSKLSVVGLPFGGAYSTVDDLERFRIALLENKLVSRPTRELMWTGVSEPEPDSEYGLGAQIGSYNGARFIYHGGGWPGVTNHFEFSPKLGTTFVVLSNYDINTQAITYRMRQWLTRGLTNRQDDSRKPEFRLSASVQLGEPAVGDSVPIQLIVSNHGGVAPSATNLN